MTCAPVTSTTLRSQPCGAGEGSAPTSHAAPYVLFMGTQPAPSSVWLERGPPRVTSSDMGSSVAAASPAAGRVEVVVGAVMVLVLWVRALLPVAAAAVEEGVGAWAEGGGGVAAARMETLVRPPSPSALLTERRSQPALSQASTRT